MQAATALVICRILKLRKRVQQLVRSRAIFVRATRYRSKSLSGTLQPLKWESIPGQNYLSIGGLPVHLYPSILFIEASKRQFCIRRKSLFQSNSYVVAYHILNTVH
jgi:hypothetical protein